MIIFKSILKCPFCGEFREEVMPEDRCIVVYQCKSCGKTLKPNKDDCCVFCSFGSEKCPPIQKLSVLE